MNTLTEKPNTGPCNIRSIASQPAFVWNEFPSVSYHIEGRRHYTLPVFENTGSSKEHLLSVFDQSVLISAERERTNANTNLVLAQSLFLFARITSGREDLPAMPASNDTVLPLIQLFLADIRMCLEERHPMLPNNGIVLADILSMFADIDTGCDHTHRSKQQKQQ